MLLRLIYVICVAVWVLAGQVTSSASLVHRYELNGSFADSGPAAGPSLSPDGGVLGASNYAFLANQGLNLSNGMSGITDNYSIVIDFSFTDTAGFRKILDFKNLIGGDTGLYNLGGKLIFYGGNGIGPTSLAPGNQVTLTSDGVSEIVTGYVGSTFQWSFLDSSSLAVFNAANNIVRFFEDDNATSNGEASSGQVDRILVYNTVLIAEDISAIPPPAAPGEGGAVPEPASMVMWGLGMMGCAVGARRRRKLV